MRHSRFGSSKVGVTYNMPTRDLNHAVVCMGMLSVSSFTRFFARVNSLPNH